MAYKQPDEETIKNIREQHELQKKLLSEMELGASQKQNNPVLNQQRDVVRSLYEIILMYEAYAHYPTMKKNFCMFAKHNYDTCKGELKQSFSYWYMYGNCCIPCNTRMGKASAEFLAIKDSNNSEYAPTYVLPLEEEIDVMLEAFEDEMSVDYY